MIHGNHYLQKNKNFPVKLLSKETSGKHVDLNMVQNNLGVRSFQMSMENEKWHAKISLLNEQVMCEGNA